MTKFDLPAEIDLTRPNPARIYDWVLGGHANWAVDREFGERVLQVCPIVRDLAMGNRLYLHRVVRHLASLGIRQFVDIGSGVPTVGHVHTIADEVAPGSRVVYADIEPVAVAHSRVLLEKTGDPTRHVAVQADLRDPDRMWQLVAESDVIDLSQPVALLLIAVLHINQPGPQGHDVSEQAVARYRDLLCPGSYLAISHGCLDGVPAQRAADMEAVKRMYDSSSTSGQFRSKAAIAGFFGEFELLEPGMVWAPQWHPEHAHPDYPNPTFADPAESVVWVGVGRKPGNNDHHAR